MDIQKYLKQELAKTLKQILAQDINLDDLKLSLPPQDDLGDYALACFELAKKNKTSPVELAKKIASAWPSDNLFISAQSAGPYLNLKLNAKIFSQLAIDEILGNKKFGQNDSGKNKKVLIEFSGPNTNKPQHIGHVRNDLLGQALVNLYRANAYKVIATNIINDRGIHIVKSMLAWQEFANGETPKSAGIKGDHLVGKYYVKFGQLLKAEEKEYLAKNNIDLTNLNDLEKRKINDDFLNQSAWMQKAREMLIRWEKNDPQVKKLWQTMNTWVYDGYKKTYNDLGIKFDHVDYESDTYLLGKDLIELGLKNNVFFKKEDGSVWIDLTAEGLDEKIVLRSDGTSVYMTQDMGTAKRRYDKFKFDQAIYIVASEQDYHFKVLFLILAKLGFTWAKNLHHLSHGMVSSPEGKIKSREGKTADADAIISETIIRTKEMMAQAEKKNLKQIDQEAIAKDVTMAAIKFCMLGTNPQKDIVYDAQNSITLDGYTGPFVQYTHARICTILSKAAKAKKINWASLEINAEEIKLIKQLVLYPEIIQQSAVEYNPAVLTHYLFDLAKIFNNFYQQHSVLSADNEDQKNFRLNICTTTKKVISDGLNILSIKAPEMM
jgi:arginyl-tRNA synthetase